jgi:hypothetical protein
MSNVFSDVNDSPTNVPSWTVQSATTGSDQSTVNGGTSPSSGSMVGPAGPQGPQGVQGAAGTNGTNGTNGTTPGLTDLGAELVANGITSASDLPAVLAALGIT